MAATETVLAIISAIRAAQGLAQTASELRQHALNEAELLKSEGHISSEQLEAIKLRAQQADASWGKLMEEISNGTFRPGPATASLPEGTSTRTETPATPSLEGE